jgi:hypothetical protein
MPIGMEYHELTVSGDIALAHFEKRPIHGYSISHPPVHADRAQAEGHIMTVPTRWQTTHLVWKRQDEMFNRHIRICSITYADK